MCNFTKKDREELKKLQEEIEEIQTLAEKFGNGQKRERSRLANQH